MFTGKPFDPSNKTLTETTPLGLSFLMRPDTGSPDVDTSSSLPVQTVSTLGLALLGLPELLKLVLRAQPRSSSSFSTLDRLPQLLPGSLVGLIVLGDSSDKKPATDAV